MTGANLIVQEQETGIEYLGQVIGIIILLYDRHTGDFVKELFCEDVNLIGSADV